MSGATHGGKGSKQRPTDKEKFSNNWDAIFGNKETKPAQETDQPNDNEEESNAS